MGDTEAAPSRVPQEPPHTPFQGMETPGPAGGAPRCQCSSAGAGARSGGAHIPAGTAAPQPRTGPDSSQSVPLAIVSSVPGSGQCSGQDSDKCIGQ